MQDNYQTNSKITKHKYTVEVEAVSYNKDTAKSLYGGSYISDYPEDVEHIQIIEDMLNESILYVLQLQTQFLAQTKKEIEDFNESEKHFWKYLQAKENTYRKIMSTLSRA